MKTFIWNREYDVLAANAETLEHARELLKPLLDELLDPILENKIKESIEYLAETDPTTVATGWYRDKDWWNKEIIYIQNDNELQKQIIFNEPDIIISENQAVIFGHYND